MNKKTGRIWMWIGAITVALIALVAVWTELSDIERFETNGSGYQAGVAAYEEGDYATAIEKLQPLAEQGHAEAQFALGYMYYYGRGVDEDKKEAAKWFRKAKKEASKWYRKAAEQGKIEAQDYVDQIGFIGENAPDFTLQTLTGERFNLAEQRGRPIFLNFWATWCPPCLAEMPDMQKLQQALGDSILIVGIDGEPADTVREFVQDRGYTWTFVLDPDNEAARTYDVSFIPTSVFIDAKGVIVRKFVGQKDYETFLKAAREAIGN